MPRPLVSVVPYRNGWLIPFVADGSCALSQAGMVTLRRVGGNGVCIILSQCPSSVPDATVIVVSVVEFVDLAGRCF